MRQAISEEILCKGSHSEKASMLKVQLALISL